MASVAPLIVMVESVAWVVPPFAVARSMVQKCIELFGSPRAWPVMVSWPSPNALTVCGTSDESETEQLMAPGFDALRRTAMSLSGCDAKYSRLNVVALRV